MADNSQLKCLKQVLFFLQIMNLFKYSKMQSLDAVLMVVFWDFVVVCLLF